MDQGEIYEIIALVLSGKADEHQHDILKSWLEESPSNVKAYNVLKESWKNTHIHLKHPREEEQFHKVLAKIKTSQTKPFASRHFLKIAASVSILLVSIWLILPNQKSMPELQVDEVAFEKSNPAGQKSSFSLPDGTKVWLNAESTLTYSGRYGKTNREVELTGEAFFNVKKDKGKEFIVTSGNFKTTALGTSFNIRAFPNEDQLNIALVTGKVRVDQYHMDAVKDISSNTYLRPGEQVVFSKENNSLKKSKFNPLQMVTWKDGTLYFDDTCFNDIVKTLERWYGVKFEVINPPDKDEILFSGEFHNKTLEGVLEAMSYSKKFDYAIDGKQITIQFN